MEQVSDFLLKVPKRLYLPIALGCIGLILFGYGIWVLVSQNASRENQVQEEFSHSSTGSGQGPTGVLGIIDSIIKVDIEGAVLRPGLYSLPKDARLQDALIASGGLSQNADRDVVAKKLNLASKLTDGAKIYIPHIGETQEAGLSTGIVETSMQGSDSQSGLISVNTASQSRLESLPGIGPVTAQKIISNRPYSSLEEVVNKKAITQKIFEKIQSQISL